MTVSVICIIIVLMTGGAAAAAEEFLLLRHEDQLDRGTDMMRYYSRNCKCF